jgi:hypothetical protein
MDHPDVGWRISFFIRGIGYVSGFLFALVALDEWRYAPDHPHRYGPANEIALASLAALGIAVALVLIATELARLTANRR